jgi:hypothetical protein
LGFIGSFCSERIFEKCFGIIASERFSDFVVDMFTGFAELNRNDTCSESVFTGFCLDGDDDVELM